MMSADDESFHGRIGRTHRESTPWWPAAPQAPAGAPNVVFIVLDDVGFSDIGCYGSEINTPRMDALASGGLRYNNFHVTAMCSPTRACLLTGRNAHAVGVGAIAEWSNGYPGYQGRISKRAATVAEILADHAYGTYAIGKWHLANLANYHAAGPHEHWPLGRGFSRWYGFLGGYVDHWNPDLHEDNHAIRHAPRPDYHLSEDLVDHAIEHVRQGAVPVFPADDEDRLAARVLKVEHEIFPKAVRWFAQGRLREESGIVWVVDPVEPQLIVRS